VDREGDALALSAQWIEVGQSATVRSTALPLPLGDLSEVVSRGMSRLAAQVASLATGSPVGNTAEPASSAAVSKPWLEKGFALRQPNREYQPPELAAYEFSKVVLAELNNATAHAARGEVYLQLQQYADALSDYDQAIRLQPRRGSHYYGRALVHDAMHQGALVCADLRRACELGDQGGCSLARRRGC
jgi:tetratricopeptide (TPR) repeat protein